MSDGFDIDADLVRKLADLLSETGLAEIEYEVNGKRVRVARPQHGVATVAAAPPAPAAATQSADAATQATDPAAHPGAVTSPMVGTVYLASAPGEPPLVREGSQVSAGQTLMLVEAMKTFNEVKAPTSGTVVRVAVESGQPVEFGELLAIIE